MTTAGGAHDSRPDELVVELPDDPGARPGGDPTDLPAATHGLLLRLAGRLPDELITQTRQWLAENRLDELARAVGYVCLDGGVSLPEDHLAVLATLLSGAGVDPEVVREIPSGAVDSAPHFEFLDAAPDAEEEAGPDRVDTVVIEAVRAVAGARGAWRAWRVALDGAPWPPPKRIVAVEVGADAELPAVTARLQRELIAAGEVNPQVEVFATGTDLPAYQRLVTGRGRLVWAAAEPEIKVAAVFDEADENGPRFHPDHPRIEDAAEVARLADYLDAGKALLVTTARLPDVVDPGRGRAVRMNFRTDGTWVWADATGYYLREHGFAPEPELCAHIARANHVVPEVDAVSVHRAMAVLMGPSDEEPVWTPDEPSDGPSDGAAPPDAEPQPDPELFDRWVAEAVRVAERALEQALASVPEAVAREAGEHGMQALLDSALSDSELETPIAIRVYQDAVFEHLVPELRSAMESPLAAYQRSLAEALRRR